MSDRQSKNYDEATKSFSSDVAKNNRSNRDIYPARNLGATNANHVSGGTSAPVGRRKQAKIFGKSQRYFTSCNDIDDTDVEEVPAALDCARRSKRKRNQSKPPRKVPRQDKYLGSNSADMDLKDLGIEIIDEAEFKSKKLCSVSEIGHSPREESSEGFSIASTWKNVDVVRKKPYASLDFSPEDDIHGSEGNGNNDVDAEEIELERIDETEYMNLITKIGSSSKEDQHEGYSAVTPRKNVCNASKKTLAADYYETYCPEDDFPQESRFPVRKVKDPKSVGSSVCRDQASVSRCSDGSNHAWQCKSSSFVQRGNNSIDAVPDEIEMEKIDEVEFRNHKKRSKSKTGQSKGEGLCVASSSKNIDRATKHISSADHSKSLSRTDCRTGYDVLVVDSSPLAKSGKIAGLTSCKASKIQEIDDAEFLNQISRNISKMGSSTRQGYSAASSRKTANIVREPTFDNYSRSFSSEDPFGDYTKGRTGKSSSFADKGNNDEDTDSEELGFEKIDESEFKKHVQSVSKIRSSTCKQPDRVHFAGTSGKNVKSLSKKKTSKGKIYKNARKREVSSYSRNKGNDEACNKNLHNDVNESSFECSSSNSSSKSSGDNISTSLPDDEISSYGAKHRMNLGIASRTRSKMGSIKKPADVGKSSLGLSHDSEFSSSFEGERSDSFDGIEEVCSYIEAEKREFSSNTGVKRQKKGASPSQSKDDFNCSDRRDDGGGGGGDDDDQDDDDDDDDDDDEIREKVETTISNIHGHAKIETTDVTEEVKEPKGSMQFSSKHFDLFSMLADAVLGSGPMLGSNEEAMEAPASQTQSTFPTKFKFEDEVPKKVEKTEQEEELDDLLAELDVNWELAKLGSFSYTKVDQENENPPNEETHYARCAKGQHQLVLQDEQGLICIFCHHVALGPKDIIPEWVEKTYQGSGRKMHSETEQPIEFDELHLQSSMNNVADFGSGTVWSIKPGIWESMFKHQREGFEFLWKNLAGSTSLDELKTADPSGVGGCIISHAPGSGKTRLTINFIETYLKMFPNSMPVIISPASMLLTWEEEFRKWEVDFPFINLNNLELLCQENKAALRLLAEAKSRNPKNIRMVKICTWSMGRSVLGISYNLFEKLTGEQCTKGRTSKKGKILDDQMQKLRKILLEKPGLVVLDEGHTPRNQRSNIWNALLKLQTEKRVILSGTPFQNNFAELFNTLRLVRPTLAGMLAQERMFAEMITRRMSTSRKYTKGEQCQSPVVSEVIDRAVDKLKISMAPFVHIHKGDILQQRVPGLRDCVVLLKPPALQKTLIERLEGSSSTFEFEHRVALISVHPYLFLHSDSTDEQKSGIDMAVLEVSKLNPNEGVKTKFIMELVRLSLVLKEKVLIFSQYLQPLKLIKEQLKEIFKWVIGKEILQMQGKLEQKHRQVLINSFNDPKSESKIMLASTKCCSEGISLVGASRVVLLDVVWNPSVERQAICRAYRVGQKKYVYTYHLMTSGTSEADKYCRQAEKERLSELVFSNSSDKSKKQKQPSLGIEDRVLEEMVGNDKLQEMFERIINQPKDKDLIQTFGLTS